MGAVSMCKDMEEGRVGREKRIFLIKREGFVSFPSMKSSPNERHNFSLNLNR